MRDCAERRKTESESERERERGRKGGEGEFYLERYSITERTKSAEAGPHNHTNKRAKHARSQETGPLFHACAKVPCVCELGNSVLSFT